MTAARHGIARRLLTVVAMSVAASCTSSPPSSTGTTRPAEPGPRAHYAANPQPAGPQVTILSPIDSGLVQASPQQNPPHHTPFGGDWAADIASTVAGEGAVYARFANPSGDLVLTIEREFDPCGVAMSGGRAVTVAVTIDGERVGEVEYVHLGSVDVGPGRIPNGARLGDMVTDPPRQSRCWANVHTHIEPRNVKGRSCFLPRHLNSDVTEATALGVLGGAWTSGPSAVCAVGRLDSVTRTEGGARLTGWAWYAHVPDQPAQVGALVDHRPAGEAIADTPRPDVGPHGFDFTVPITGDPRVVCATARAVAGAPDVPLPDCRRL